MAKSTKNQKTIKIQKLIPDTSVIIEGIISKQIKAKKLIPNEIYIHEAVISELEHQANSNQTIGHLGLEEIQKLVENQKNSYEVKFTGKKPSMVDIKYAKLGDIDSIIRDLAFETSGTLMTADKIQAKVAKAKGIDLYFIDIESKTKKLKLEKYFDEQTMSVHLRENTFPYGKRGVPGNWSTQTIGKKIIQRDDIIEISRELTEEANIRKDGFIEIERPGSTIIQLANFRIVITMPPLSDGWEITAVRPVTKLTLADYTLSEKLKERIEKHAEGILVAGSPGMGKSTFAQALGEFYANMNKTVKTVEAPRDLVLPETITQYAISHGTSEEIHDILLLTRPDYTIFDEMRNTDDFNLFADLRLSGVGMIGIVHATNAVDSIQRFMNRVELGVIPQIIDTVIFIKNGKAEKILNLAMTVKCPSGMTEADLARPVVEVKDFETEKLEYEIYTYGEQTVVMPVSMAGKKEMQPPIHGLAKKSIEEEIKKYTNKVNVEVISDNKIKIYVPEKDISKIIGKQGKTIDQIEKSLGLSIEVEELQKSNKQDYDENQETYERSDKQKSIPFQIRQTKKSVQFDLGGKYKNHEVDIIVNGDYLLSAKVGSSGNIKINKKNNFGKLLEQAIDNKENIEVILTQ